VDITIADNALNLSKDPKADFEVLKHNLGPIRNTIGPNVHITHFSRVYLSTGGWVGMINYLTDHLDHVTGRAALEADSGSGLASVRIVSHPKETLGMFKHGSKDVVHRVIEEPVSSEALAQALARVKVDPFALREG
jgi:hypothetical protein